MSLSLPVVTLSTPEPAIIILSPSPATTISLPACDGEVLTASTNTPASVKVNSALSAAIISAPKPVSISSLPRPEIIILLPSLAAITSRSPSFGAILIAEVRTPTPVNRKSTLSPAIISLPMTVVAPAVTSSEAEPAIIILLPPASITVSIPPASVCVLSARIRTPELLKSSCALSLAIMSLPVPVLIPSLPCPVTIILLPLATVTTSSPLVSAKLDKSTNTPAL